MTTDKRQEKLCELGNLIAQYNAGERENINASEYPQWVVVYDMLKSAEIDDEIFDEFISAPEKYKVVNGKIIYNSNWQAEKIQAKEDAFNNAFFETSLGFIRREVSMKNGTTKTFLTDMLPQLIVGFPILAYSKPDFTKDIDIVDYQKQVEVTEEFLVECRNQLIIDFYGFNPMV